MQRTLFLVKPDAIQRGLAGEIVSRLERRGLKLAGLKLMRVRDELARRLYAAHEGKPFFRRARRLHYVEPDNRDGCGREKRHRTGAHNHGSDLPRKTPVPARFAETWPWS